MTEEHCFMSFYDHNASTFSGCQLRKLRLIVAIVLKLRALEFSPALRARTQPSPGRQRLAALTDSVKSRPGAGFRFPA
jgi:hypothetical protein